MITGRTRSVFLGMLSMALCAGNAHAGENSVLFSTIGGVVSPSPYGVSSQNFTDVPDYFTAAADDFTIPVQDGSWRIESVDVLGTYTGVGGDPTTADSINVYILGDDGGLPDTTNLAARSIYAYENGAFVNPGAGSFQITLPEDGVVLPAGTYWLCVQVNQGGGQWFWTESAQAANSGVANGNESAWFESQTFIAGGACTGAWGSRVSTCGVGEADNPPPELDLGFALNGSIANCRLYADFEGVALPAGWSTIDNDGNNDANARPDSWYLDYWVSAGMQTAHYCPEIANNQSVHSSSWFTPAGQADNWLISPEITLGANDTLRWLATAFESQPFQDGYEVRISTTGSDIADFMSTPALFSIASENVGWVERSIDLTAAGYANATCRIAFHHNANDDNVIVIDEIAVGDECPITMCATEGEGEGEGQPNEAFDCDGAMVADNLGTAAGTAIQINYRDADFGGVGGDLTFIVPHPAGTDEIRIQSSDGYDGTHAAEAGTQTNIVLNTQGDATPDPDERSTTYTITLIKEAAEGAACTVTTTWAAASCNITFDPAAPAIGQSVNVNVELVNAKPDATDTVAQLTADAPNWAGVVNLSSLNPSSVAGNTVSYTPATNIASFAAGDAGAYNLGFLSVGGIGNTTRCTATLAEGTGEGEGEGEDVGGGLHTADQNGNLLISLSELLRVIQFYNSAGFSCADPPASTEDGYQPGPGGMACATHASDYNPQDFQINLSELLRLIQFFNSGGYYACPGAVPPTEDGYCPGQP